MVHAEKIVTAVARGTVNTRWRDFADVYLLSRRHPLIGADLTDSVRQVARHRQVERFHSPGFSTATARSDRRDGQPGGESSG
jgi:hypothetical protein